MRADELWQDSIVALRALRRNPGYAVVVVVTLTVGIAANSVIFSWMNPYFLRELPFGEPERLVQLGQIDTERGWDHARVSIPQYHDWRARSRSFRDLGAYYYASRNVTGEREPESLVAGVLTGNLFGVLDAPALIGRTFGKGEDGPGAAPVVVLSHGLWQRRYGGDEGVLGRDIPLDGVAHTVIGVMPPRFNFPYGDAKMWVPMLEDPALEPRERTFVYPVGRLGEGVSREQARAELEAVHSELAARFPQADGRFEGVSVVPLREALNFAYDILQLSFTAMLGAVVFVLVIACVNVASLTLARLGARSREIAVRSALGAGSFRLVRQLLVESLLLAAVGGALGTAISYAAARHLGPIIPESIFRVGEVSVDGAVLAFTLGISLLTPLAFGLAPALTAARGRLAAALKQGGRGGGEGAGSLRGRRALVVVEVALAIALVTGTGLMLRSFLAIQEVEIGFRAQNVLTVALSPPESDYPEMAQVESFYDRAMIEIEALPGVSGVGAVRPLPMNHAWFTTPFARPGNVPASPEEWPTALQTHVSSGYFEAMGIPVLAGRSFEDSDDAPSAKVVIISRRTAEDHWPGESPIGATILFEDARAPERATIVGVVSDVKHTGFEESLNASIYQPLRQSPRRARFLVVGAAASPSALAEPVREALRGVDADLPLVIRPMPELVRENALQWAVGSAALGVFGSIALALASLGIYGIVSYSVVQRRREIGIRMTLGASSTEVLRAIVGDALRLTAFGIAAGLLLSFGAGRLMAAMLFGVGPFDPLTFGVVLALFVVVALAASFLPARRAAAVDPIGVLRCD